MFISTVAFIACSIGYYAGTQKIEIVKNEKPIENKSVKTFKQISKKPDTWKSVTMNVSAYCPCKKCCGDFADGHTANGYKIKENDRFVAAPKNYYFGTEMIVPGYNNGKVVVVRDRGGAIKGNKLDVYFDTHQEALNFGRQKISVKVRIIPEN